MGDKSDNLLDMMLDDSSQAVKKDLGKRQRHAEPEPTAPEPAPEPKAWPQDTEQLLELTGGDLRIWLAAVKPGDLLCVVAEGSGSLRQRIIGQLDESSVEWLEGNLKLWDTPTDRLLNDSREAVLEVARELVADGKIAPPQSTEHLGKSQDIIDDVGREELARTLVELVAVAQSNGIESLAELIDEAPHPMLQFGLTSLLALQDEDKLEKTLRERREALVETYAAELELINQAVLAMARGSSAEAFLERIKLAKS